MTAAPLGAAVMPREGGAQFTPAAFRAIAAMSRGIPRVINTLCDRALEIGFERQAMLDESIVAAAAEQLRLLMEAAPRPAGFGALRSSEPLSSSDGAAVEDTDGVASPEESRFGLKHLAIAVVLLGAGAGGWWIATHRPAARAQAPAAALSVAPAPAGQPSTSGTPAPDQPSSSTPSSASGSAPADQKSAAGDKYYIAVAAFRTAQRASEVAGQIAASGLPASTREASAGSFGSWQQVIVGPFASTSEAAAAQQTLVRRGYAKTRIITEAPAR
jgi:cell division septation protein DedD